MYCISLPTSHMCICNDSKEWASYCSSTGGHACWGMSPSRLKKIYTFKDSSGLGTSSQPKSDRMETFKVKWSDIPNDLQTKTYYRHHCTWASMLGKVRSCHYNTIGHTHTHLGKQIHEFKQNLFEFIYLFFFVI